MLSGGAMAVSVYAIKSMVVVDGVLILSILIFAGASVYFALLLCHPTIRDNVSSRISRVLHKSVQ
jgi:hypothetical protein